MPKTTRSSTWNASTHTTNDNLNCPGDSGGPIWGDGFNGARQTSDPAQFVSAEGGGGGDVNANRDSVGPWETFTVAYH